MRNSILCASLNSYLYGYLKNVKDIGIPKYNQYAGNKITTINTIVKEYVNRHPEYACLMECKYPKVRDPNGVLKGGAGTIEKLNKIYNAVKSVEPAKVQVERNETEQLNQLLDKIEEKLQSVHVNPDGTKQSSLLPSNAIVDAGLVQSTIDIIKAGLVNLDTIDVTKDLGKIPTKLLSSVNYTEIKIQDIVEKFESKLNKIINDTSKDDTKMQTDLEQLKSEIAKETVSVVAKNEELIKAITSLNETIQEIVNSLEYQFNQDEIKIVPEFDDFLNEMNGISEISGLITNVRKMKSDGNSLSACIEFFNSEILPFIQIVRNKTKYKEFNKYYDGINNMRINNMFFAREGVINTSMLRDLITQDGDIKMIEKDFNKSILEFPQSLIKDTDGSSLDAAQTKEPEKSPSVAALISKIQKPKVGGANGEKNIRDMLDKNSELLSNLFKYNQSIKKYNDMVEKHRTLLIHYLMHNIFLVMIATNQLLVSGYVVHEYIQRGTISLYNRILKNMAEDMKTEPEKPQNKYLLRYHKFTIMKLSSFAEKIMNHLNTIKSNKMRECKYKTCDASGPDFDKCGIIRKICLKDDVIDINECTGITRELFLLLNHFKGIMMQYNAISGNKITVYARINDLGQQMPPSSPESCRELMYLSMFDKNAQVGQCGVQKDTLGGPIDVQNLEIHPEVCESLETIGINPKQFTELDKNIKFTEVFDPTQFPTSSEISKYMTIDTLLSQGNGIGMMTYGYSGTGKSFTLFGSASTNVAGILQTTLNDVNGLKDVKFRLIEIYGYGMPYPDYWKSGQDKISHWIYNYKSQTGGPEGLDFNDVEVIPATEFADFMDCKNKYAGDTTYCTIQENLVSEVFKKFEKFVNKVDKERETKKRIRDTPNNPVSSRSVVIYDFQLSVFDKKEPVPFLIIDLPGREEIVQTYVEPYLTNPVILNILGYNETRIKELKLILGIAALNPLGLSVFASEIIMKELIKFVNEQKDDVKRQEAIKNIIGERKDSFNIKQGKDPKASFGVWVAGIRKKNSNKTVTEITTPFKGVNVSGDFNLEDEFVNLHGYKLGQWFEINSTGKSIEFVLKPNAESSFYTSPEQFKMVLGTHLMNRIIMSQRFDLLERIIIQVCNENINNVIRNKIAKMSETEIRGILNKLVSINYKSSYWYSNSKSIDELITQHNNKNDNKLMEILGYNYYLTPYEGIYINENIIGLIKYLATKKQLGNSMDSKQIEEVDKKVGATICEQNKSLVFSYQQKVVRVWAMKDGGITDQTIKKFFNFPEKDIITTNGKCISKISSELPLRLFKNTEKLEMNYAGNILDATYNKLKESYKSDYIFNFKNPLITKILNPYMKKLFGYNVLYLLANYKDETKRESRCHHQYKLLQNTTDFIASIAGKK